MSRLPDGKEILSHAPIREWFAIPDIIKREYPRIPSYELGNTYNNATRMLNWAVKWKDCQKKREHGKTLWCL